MRQRDGFSGGGGESTSGRRKVVGQEGTVLLLRHSEEVSVAGTARARLARDDLVRKLGPDQAGPR